MKTIFRKNLQKVIESNGSLIFSCTFTKSDGTKRKMVCRTGVKKYLKGGELPYDPVEKGLLPVFDLEKMAYRMIPLSRVETIKIAKKPEFKVK